jgi:TolA-binding protein
MKRIVKRQPVSLLAIACLGTALVSGMSVTPAMAQLTQATTTTAATVADGKKSQARINQIDDQIQDIVQDYRETIDHLQDLREYNAIKRKIVKDQDARIIVLRNEITNVADIQRDMPPLIDEMIGVIDAFIQKDLPFLSNERSERVAKLRADFDRSDVSTAEKYRKSLEAFQIENDYGRAIESYEGTLLLGDRELEVNFLMVGRVALYYQTKDQSETGMWDIEAGDWTSDLPGGATEQINTAIGVANEFVPPDLLILPLPAPKDA